MPVQTRYAHNKEVTVAYETFGDPATGEPLLLISGLDFQMVWWPDAFCEQLAERGFAVVRFDHRDSGLSTKFDSAKKENPFLALLGRTKPSYTTLDMLDDAIAVMDATGWKNAHVMGASMGAALAPGDGALPPGPGPHPDLRDGRARRCQRYRRPELHQIRRLRQTAQDQAG
jgi:pimeloyl-ACP methyl ester carboxylesterase